jgi:3-oxoadipate enol-lactonase
MPFTSVRDIEIYYEIQGEGPPLLFFNGTGGDLRRKPGIFESPLPASFRMLAYDQRGLGQTSTPATQPAMRDYAEDAAALVDALGWPPCAVLGISFGGMVAQEFAIRFPARVTRMVLACTSSGGAGGASYPLHELSALPQRDRAMRHMALADALFDDAWQAAHQQVVERTVAQTPPTLSKGELMQLEARRAHDTYDRLGSLTMPVYVCGGTRDGIAPPSNLEAIAAAIPNPRLEFFDGGHLFMVQDRRAFPAMVEFLISQRLPSAQQ